MVFKNSTAKLKKQFKTGNAATSSSDGCASKKIVLN
jgi:hypothetical protein